MIASANSEHLVIRAARGERTERTPVWLMRQAGRFDPAYRELREKDGRPLEALFADPDAATEISLLPQRFGVDAIIFFQDILTPLGPLGAPFVFRPGPELDNVPRTADDLAKLKQYDPANELPFVRETLQRVKQRLGGALPLLGFAGAPATLACFLLAGKSPGTEATAARQLFESDPKTAHELLTKLADMTAAYLRLQLDSGADAVQLFESCADALSESEYHAFAAPYQRRVFEQLPAEALTMLFAREQADMNLMVETGAKVLSVGACVDLAQARAQLGGRVALQGNVDNRTLAYGNLQQVEAEVRACITAGQHTGHILNLNHGLLKDTPVEHVQQMIALAHEMTVDSVGSVGSPGS